MRRQYSTAELLALFDHEWWENYIPDHDESRKADDVGLDGMANMLGVDANASPEERAAAAARARGRYDASIGLYVDPETGLPL